MIKEVFRIANEAVKKGAEGVTIKVTTVWLKRKVDGLFQFVTLIPGKRR